MLYLCLLYIHYNLAIYPKQAVAYKICPTDMENDKNMVAEIDFLSKKTRCRRLPFYATKTIFGLLKDNTADVKFNSGWKMVHYKWHIW